MIAVLDFIKKYWVLVTFLASEVATLIVFSRTIINGTKCSLRNDILTIYDRCKDTKQITHYQLQSIEQSYELYRKLKGNSFVEEVVSRVHNFEIID